MQTTPTYDRATWRLLINSAAEPGAVAMAIDEVLLRGVAARHSPPTLRLYRWLSPTLILGRGQPASDVDLQILHEHKITLLRRISGGTAVLNRNDLSYAVVVCDDDPRFGGAVAESYRGVGLALQEAMRRLGVNGATATFRDPATRSNSASRRTPVCFELPSDFEIVVDGRKLLGSSQARIRGGILQHGSLPLASDIADISQYLSSHPDPARIREQALTLSDALGCPVPWEDVAEIIISSFRDCLALDLAPGALTPAEQSDVERLAFTKYGDDRWTKRL